MAHRIQLKSDIQIRSEHEEVTYNVNVTANEITLQISHDDTTEDAPAMDLLNCTLSLETFKQMPRLKPNSLIALAIPSTNFLYKQIDAHIDIKPLMLINISGFSKDSKAKNPASKHLTTVPCYLFIYARDIVNGTFDDFDIILHVPSKSFTLNSNIAFDAPIDISEFTHAIFPDEITVTEDTEYSNTEYYKFNVSAPAYNDEIYVEPVYGITDKTRITLTSGQGSIRVLKSSVEAGNNIRVKLGFYSYTGLAEINKTV